MSSHILAIKPKDFIDSRDSTGDLILSIGRCAGHPNQKPNPGWLDEHGKPGRPSAAGTVSG
jgi:hypothetical protein